MNSPWYKDAIIYSLDVDTFKDGNGDGIGDFQGLTKSCRYLSGLGINCVWLLPFYPSPNRDNGYDIIDYYSVDPRLGTLGDFVEFVNEAGNRKIRVMVDLVLNHTSADHPWFQQARQSRESPYHHYYVWRYTPPPDTSREAIFPPEQQGIWRYEKNVDAWYLHRFYHHQPDLNIANPAVREEMKKVMAFWLKLGVSGFRVDAVPYLVEVRNWHGHEVESKFDFAYLREFRDFLSWHKGDAIMLAEANVSPQDQLQYFGHGNRMHMVLNFFINQHLFYSIASQSAAPLAGALSQMPPLPPQSQWGLFLRNHDELSLDQLTEEQREECFRQFGPEENMRIFFRGVRRRLAPILGEDRRKLLLAYSLLFSLPGTPVLYYGEEIGMGDNLSLPGRFSVRTPMQWSSENNAGFSSAPQERLIRPVVSTGKFSYTKINVESQERDTHSLLSAIQQMIRLRQHHPEFGCGKWRPLKTSSPHAILAHCCEWQGETSAAVHNFTESAQAFTLQVEAPQRGVASVTFGGDQGGDERPIEDGCCTLELEPFGSRWIRLRQT